MGQHVYLEPWDNEDVESMLLAMELFLLVRHTHPPLRMKMEDIHTQQHTRPQADIDVHTTASTPMENCSKG